MGSAIITPYKNSEGKYRFRCVKKNENGSTSTLPDIVVNADFSIEEKPSPELENTWEKTKLEEIPVEIVKALICKLNYLE